MDLFHQNIFKEFDRLYKIDEAERAGSVPQESRINAIHRDSGRFLYMISRASRAKRILEIGTSQGVSTMWFGWAALENQGKVITIEINPERAKAAQENFHRVGLSEVITVMVGDAKQIISTLTPPFDIILIDTTKADYCDYLRLVAPLLRVGGMVLADNAISHAGQLQEYFALLEKMKFQSIVIPTGAGLEFSIKTEG
jgi:caffeoyl-CoA O-methyltransferase